MSKIPQILQIILFYFLLFSLELLLDGLGLVTSEKQTRIYYCLCEDKILTLSN